MTNPWARPANPAPPAPPPPPQAHPAAPPPTGPTTKGTSLRAKIKNLFRDPLSIVLVVVIVVALIMSGLLIGELYARGRANGVVARVVSCVVQDKATASFDPLPPFLLQHVTGHYTNINIETAGNQVREAKGMKMTLNIDDVRLTDSANSSGTVGSLQAAITWSSDGIKQTLQQAIPLIGGFVTGVTTDPSAGTIELEAPLGSITAKPQVADNGISLQVTELTGLGFSLPREIIQPMLNDFTAKLTKDYPMGVHADSVEVTDSGVVSHFSTQNASIPKSTDDPCFAGL